MYRDIFSLFCCTQRQPMVEVQPLSGSSGFDIKIWSEDNARSGEFVCKASCFRVTRKDLSKALSLKFDNRPTCGVDDLVIRKVRMSNRLPSVQSCRERWPKRIRKLTIRTLKFSFCDALLAWNFLVRLYPVEVIAHFSSL